MSYSSSEIKSGFLITCAIALLLALVFYIGGYKTGAKDTYQIRFGYVGGLETNAPVYFAGRESGKVNKIEILAGEEKPILMTVEVAQNVRLRENSNAFIDTLGLMGEKFVELTPGTADAVYINPGTTFQGTDPIPMYKMIMKMDMLADRMDSMTKSLIPLTSNMNTLLEKHQEEISSMITNLNIVSANVRDLTADLKKRPWRLVRKNS